MITKILFIFLLLIVIVLSGLVYLNEFVLPVRFKELLIQKTSEVLQRDVSIESLEYTPLQGLIITNIVISEKKPQRGAFVTIEEISLSALPFFPLAKQKIIVPSVVIKNPTLHISRDRLGNWNIQDLIDFKKTPEEKSSWDVYFASVSTDGGSIIFSDKKIAREPIAIIENISLRSSLSLPHKAQLTVRIQPSKQNPSRIFANSNIDLLSGDFITQANIENLCLVTFQNYFPQKAFYLKEGNIKVASLEMRRENKQISAKGSANLSTLEIFTNQKARLSAPVSVLIENLILKENNLRINGIIESLNAAVSLPDNSKFKAALSYDFTITKDKHEITSSGPIKITNAFLFLNAERTFQAHAKGKISFALDKNNILNLQADLGLQEATLKFDQNKILDSKPYLNFSYVFNPQLKKESTSYTGTATLTSASITGIPWIEAVDQVSGSLSFKPNQISSTGLQGIVQQSPFTLSGSLSNFQKPSINIKGNLYQINLRRMQDIFSAVNPNLPVNLEGLADLSFDYQGNLESVENASYTGTATLTSASITGIPWIEAVDQVSGSLSFKPNQISSTGLQGIVQQSPFTLSGSLSNFQKPSINIKGNLYQINLRKMQDIFSAVNPNLPVNLEGLADLSFDYQGNLESLERSRIDLSAKIIHANLSSDFLPEDLTNISGNIEYASRRLSTKHFLPNQSGWENLNFTFAGREYTAQGTLNFNNWFLRITSEDLTLSTQGNLSSRKINIASFKASYLNSNLDLKGTIFHGQRDKKLSMNVSAEGNIQLEHLSNLFQGLDENQHWQIWQPKGLINFNGNLSGDLKNWQDWRLFLRANSQKMSLRNFQLENTALQFNQQERSITTCILKARAYGGSLDFQATGHLKEKSLPYQSKVTLLNLDLFELKKDIPFKKNPIAGLVSLSYAGKGDVFDLNQTTGQGNFTAKKGQFMHIDLFKGLGQLLFIPEYQNITFESIDSNFTIKDQVVFIQDGILRSNQMRLTCNGTVDFQGNLDLDIISRFDRSVIRQSRSLRKTIASVLTQADDFLTIKLTGTLQDPNYYIVPEPFRLLEKTRDFIFEGLPSIFEEIF